MSGVAQKKNKQLLSNFKLGKRKKREDENRVGGGEKKKPPTERKKEKRNSYWGRKKLSTFQKGRMKKIDRSWAEKKKKAMSNYGDPRREKGGHSSEKRGGKVFSTAEKN